MLVLSYHDVERLLPMDECIDVMADALAALARGEMYQPLRSIAKPPDADGLMGLMPAYRGGERPAFALKAINVIPDNPRRRGLDTHQGAVLLSSGETGELEAVVNASAITEIRTAAVSGAATRALARDDAEVLAVLGAGVQARSHLQRDGGRSRMGARSHLVARSRAGAPAGRRARAAVRAGGRRERGGSRARRGRRRHSDGVARAGRRAASGSLPARTSTPSAPASRTRASSTGRRWRRRR